MFLLAHQQRLGALIPKMSIANVIASGSKMRKTSGNLQFPQNCTFPEVFQIFDPLITIFAIDIYIFLESAWQGATDESEHIQKVPWSKGTLSKGTLS